MKIKDHNKKKNIYTWTNSNKQTDNKYYPISPQGTSDIARGKGLLKNTKSNNQKV